MTPILLLAGMLTVALDGGGFLTQEASLRRSMLGTTELSVALRPLPLFELSLGYGIAGRKDSFGGLDFSTTYQRVPLRLGALFQVGRAGLAVGLGPALIVTRTRALDQSVEVIESDRSLALAVSTRAETPLFALDGKGELLARVIFEVYQRGRRTDVSMMAGVSWRFGLD